MLLLALTLFKARFTLELELVQALWSVFSSRFSGNFRLEFFVLANGKLVTRRRRGKKLHTKQVTHVVQSNKVNRNQECLKEAEVSFSSF